MKGIGVPLKMPLKGLGSVKLEHPFIASVLDLFDGVVVGVGNLEIADNA